MTRPDGNDGTYFMWQDSSGNRYEPGAQVPANVGRLTAQWEDIENPVITGVVNDDTNPDTGAITSPQTGDNSHRGHCGLHFSLSAAVC